MTNLSHFHQELVTLVVPTKKWGHTHQAVVWTMDQYWYDHSDTQLSLFLSPNLLLCYQHNVTRLIPINNVPPFLSHPLGALHRYIVTELIQSQCPVHPIYLPLQKNLPRSLPPPKKKKERKTTSYPEAHPLSLSLSVITFILKHPPLSLSGYKMYPEAPTALSEYCSQQWTGLWQSSTQHTPVWWLPPIRNFSLLAYYGRKRTVLEQASHLLGGEAEKGVMGVGVEVT